MERSKKEGEKKGLDHCFRSFKKEVHSSKLQAERKHQSANK